MTGIKGYICLVIGLCMMMVGALGALAGVFCLLVVNAMTGLELIGASAVLFGLGVFIGSRLIEDDMLLD